MDGSKGTPTWQSAGGAERRNGEDIVARPSPSPFQPFLLAPPRRLYFSVFRRHPFISRPASAPRACSNDHLNAPNTLAYDPLWPFHTKPCLSSRPGTRDLSPISLSPLSRTTGRTCSSPAAKMAILCSVSGPATGSGPSSDTRARCGVVSYRQILPAQHRAAQTSQRTLIHASTHPVVCCAPLLNSFLALISKIWDTYTGECLQSFPHNHIVRSVALSPSSSHLLTGGQEKKVRMFDINRPDAEPDLLFDGPGPLSHDGTVKSVVWVGEHTGVSAGEDGQIK